MGIKKRVDPWEGSVLLSWLPELLLLSVLVCRLKIEFAEDGL